MLPLWTGNGDFVVEVFFEELACLVFFVVGDFFAVDFFVVLFILDVVLRVVFFFF